MKLNYLVIHCTATREGQAVTKQDIEEWHLKGRGWRVLGYADLICINGYLLSLIPFDTDDEVDNWEISNGVRGLNSVSRHVVYAGGCDQQLKPKDTRTPAQTSCLTDYVRYTVRRHSDIKVAGHYHFSAKACPSFDVENFCEEIGIPNKNIYRKA